jgi:hypothetical protein
MNSLQGWRKMIRLILAPNSTEGIEEKLLKLKNTKSGENTPKIIENEKRATHLETRFNHKDHLY